MSLFYQIRGDNMTQMSIIHILQLFSYPPYFFFFFNRYLFCIHSFQNTSRICVQQSFYPQFENNSMYGSNNIFSRNNGSSQPYSYSSPNPSYTRNTTQKLGSYRTQYKFDDPPSHLTAVIQNWKVTPPLSITARQQLLHLSPTEVRVEDYYMIRKKMLKSSHEDKLRDAIRSNSFNEALMKNQCYNLLPFSRDRPYDFDTIKSMARKTDGYNSNNSYSSNNNYSSSGQNNNSSFMRTSSNNIFNGSSNISNNNNNSYNGNSNSNIFGRNNTSGGGNNSMSNSNIFVRGNNNNMSNSSNNNIFSQNQNSNSNNYSYNNNGNSNNNSNIFNRDGNSGNSHIFGQNSNNNNGNNNNMNNNNNSNIFGRGTNTNNGSNIFGNNSGSNIFNGNNGNNYGNNNGNNRGNNIFGGNGSNIFGNQSNNNNYNNGGNQLFSNNNQNYGYNGNNVPMNFMSPEVFQELTSTLKSFSQLFKQVKGEPVDSHQTANANPSNSNSIFGESINFDNGFYDINNTMNRKRRQQQEVNIKIVTGQPSKRNNFTRGETIKEEQSRSYQNQDFTGSRIRQGVSQIDKNGFKTQYFNEPDQKLSKSQKFNNSGSQRTQLSRIRAPLQICSQPCVIHFQLNINWIDWNESKGVIEYTILTQTVNCQQLKPSNKNWLSNIVKKLKDSNPIIRSDAAIQINHQQNVSNNGQNIFKINGTLSQKIINLDHYQIQYRNVNKDFIYKLQITNRNGEVRWEKPINFKELDFKKDEQQDFTLDENQISCNIPQLNDKCVVCFNKLPRKISAQMMKPNSSKQNIFNFFSERIMAKTNNRFQLLDIWNNDETGDEGWEIIVHKFN